MKSYNKARLREINENDLEMILRWRNSERVRANMFTDHIITIDEHRQWFQNLKEKDNDVFLIFEYDRTPYGLTCFNQIDKLNYNCFWGFYLGINNPEPGFGTIMAYVSLNYAFFSLEVKKIYGKVFAFNTASIKLFKKMGFHQECYLKQHVLKKGSYEDVIIFALSKDKWQLISNNDKIREFIF
ncbi:MAG: UDP-4-amino-4,6-dideoxy-N-acetyl-beta-L-altrosamine N-acetyltransferase [Bacillota bacterium]